MVVPRFRQSGRIGALQTAMQPRSYVLAGVFGQIVLAIANAFWLGSPQPYTITTSRSLVTAFVAFPVLLIDPERVQPAA